MYSGFLLSFGLISLCFSIFQRDMANIQGISSHPIPRTHFHQLAKYRHMCVLPSTPPRYLLVPLINELLPLC